MIRALIIDNYDSFTYNLYQLIGELLSKQKTPFVFDVVRNDAITLEEIRKKEYNRIIISPGPGDPSDPSYFGVCSQVLLELGQTIPVLGVCLGMQGMGHYFGGQVIRAKLPMHGKTSQIKHNSQGVFTNLPQKLEVMRYHSLVVNPHTLPSCLEITAITSHDANLLEDLDLPTLLSQHLDSIEIMGLRHKHYPIEGVQFHPESFATEGGAMMLQNFLFRPT